jgi:hypothetical protein
VKVGDLVREKTRMTRKPDMGIVLDVDYTQHVDVDGLACPYRVRFFDGETHWMREGFLEVVSRP